MGANIACALILAALFQLLGVWYALYAFGFYVGLLFLHEYHLQLFLAKQKRIDRELRDILSREY